MFDGVTPPSALPVPSAPWQLAQGNTGAGTFTPDIMANISVPDGLVPVV